MKNRKRFFLLCLIATAAVSLASLTISSARGSLSRLTNLQMVNSASLDGHTTRNRQLDKYLVEAGRRNGIDPVLLLALVHQESRFKSNAVSHKGARGYAQLMPGTARALGVKNINDPRQNLHGGAKYLRQMLRKFNGNLALALAAYNAGPGRVRGWQVPKIRETQNYVVKIGDDYSKRRPGALRGR